MRLTAAIAVIYLTTWLSITMPRSTAPSPPSSYMVGGKQYIVVAAGGNVQVDSKRGNSIIAFTLE